MLFLYDKDYFLLLLKIQILINILLIPKVINLLFISTRSFIIYICLNITWFLNKLIHGHEILIWVKIIVIFYLFVVSLKVSAKPNSALHIWQQDQQ